MPKMLRYVIYFLWLLSGSIEYKPPDPNKYVRVIANSQLNPFGNPYSTIKYLLYP